MQFRSTSREAIRNIPTPESKNEIDNEKSIFTNLGELKNIMKSFKKSQIDLFNAKKNVKKVECESDLLFEKFKVLEDKVVETNLRQNEISCNKNALCFEAIIFYN